MCSTDTSTTIHRCILFSSLPPSLLQCSPDGRADEQLVFINPSTSVRQIGTDPLILLDDVMCCCIKFTRNTTLALPLPDLSFLFPFPFLFSTHLSFLFSSSSLKHHQNSTGSAMHCAWIRQLQLCQSRCPVLRPSYLFITHILSY